jgi:hypothetical protein
VSFPPGDGKSHRRGSESTRTLGTMDPLPAFRAPGVTHDHVMAGLVPAIPIL